MRLKKTHLAKHRIGWEDQIAKSACGAWSSWRTYDQLPLVTCKSCLRTERYKALAVRRLMATAPRWPERDPRLPSYKELADAVSAAAGLCGDRRFDGTPFPRRSVAATLRRLARRLKEGTR